MGNFIKENSSKNNIKSFLGAFLGASLFPIIEYFYFNNPVTFWEATVQTLFIAISVTAGFMFFVGFFQGIELQKIL